MRMCVAFNVTFLLQFSIGGYFHRQSRDGHEFDKYILRITNNQLDNEILDK